MLITTILFVMSVGIVISSLDVYPRNTAVLVGQRMELECKLNHNETVNRWTATRVGGKAEVILQNSGNQDITYFDARFGQNGDGILYLNRTELTDAGVYTWFKNEDAVQSSAQLIVLESNPVCESNISTGDDSLPYGINTWMRCRVNVSTVGNWYPSMEWIQHHEDTQLIRNDSVTITTNTTVTSVLHVSTNSIENGSYFSCKTFFRPYIGPVKTTAYNIPDFRFIWNSTKIIFQENTLSTAKDLDVRDTLMSSDSKMATSVTTALIGGNVPNSASNYWFSVSLSLVAVVMIFFVLMATMVLSFYIYRKRITTGRAHPVHVSNLVSLDRPISNPYDMIAFTHEDGYDNIDDINVTDLKVQVKVSRRVGTLPTPGMKVSRRVGTLPTPGYDHLLPQRSSPTIYCPIGNCEQPLDKEDAKISPGHIPECEQDVNAKAKCPPYTEIIY